MIRHRTRILSVFYMIAKLADNLKEEPVCRTLEVADINTVSHTKWTLKPTRG